MSNEISKAIKRKTDAQFRTMGEDRTPSVSETSGGDTIIVDPGVYQIPYVAGKNIHIGTSGNSKVINALMNILAGQNIEVSEPGEDGTVTISSTIGGKAIDLSGLADGYVLKYDLAADKFVLGEGGGISAVPQATETEMGGIKAAERTTESSEVKIDPATGKLYANAPDEALNGLPAGGSAGQVLSKVDGTDYNAAWSDPPSGGGGGFYAWNFPTEAITIGQSGTGVLSSSSYAIATTTLTLGRVARVSNVLWRVGQAGTWTLAIDGVVMDTKTSSGAGVVTFDAETVIPVGPHSISIASSPSARIQYINSASHIDRWLQISGWEELGSSYHLPVRLVCEAGELTEVTL